MKTTEQTSNQLERFIKKIADKFHASQDDAVFTDIHIQANQESGELMAFDDDDNEITHCIIEQWIGNKDSDFYDSIAKVLQNVFSRNHQIVDNMGLFKPYSFVLENEEKENIAEIYICDDDIAIIHDDLMKNLDADLDNFLTELLKDETK